MLEPVHLLVALSEGPGSTSHLLQIPNVPRALRAAAFGALGPMGNHVHADWRATTVTWSAEHWAEREGRQASCAHLLVALAEQADPDVIAACRSTGVDLDETCAHALTELGWTRGHIPALEHLYPAGTGDRPPLPVDELPADAWGRAPDPTTRVCPSRGSGTAGSWARSEGSREMRRGAAPIVTTSPTTPGTR